MFWYEDEVQRLERDHMPPGYDPKTIFYGSSSIRMWTSLHDDFRDLKPVNLGFGGSTLAACVWFFDRIMAPFHPERMVVYAGDNDLGDGRHPEEVYIFFQQLVSKVHKRFGEIPCYFVSLKPSISRWNLAHQFTYTNQIIEGAIREYGNWHFINVYGYMLNEEGSPNAECFGEDGLHMNERGYQIWKEVIGQALYNS